MKRIFLIVLVAFVSVGCYSTWDVGPKALAPLNSYNEGTAVLLKDTDGSEFTFDRNTSLRFTSSAGPSNETKFALTQINGSMLTGTARPDGHAFAIDLRQVFSVRARKFSYFKTGLAIGVPIAVTVAVVSIIASVMSNSSSNNNAGDGSMALSGTSLRHR